MGISEIRVGHGFDVHQFAEGRKLILGGCEINYSQGLLGHSDADVLTHALTDAILGASAKGDIGRWFPDNDLQYAGADSCNLLKIVWAAVISEGWRLSNCDVVVMAEKPKLAEKIDQMRARLAEVLNVEVDRIGIKATTTEKLGFVGREEGIAASAVVLLVR